MAVEIPPPSQQEVATAVRLALPQGVPLSVPDLRLTAGVRSAQLTTQGTGTANLPRAAVGLLTVTTASADPVLMAISATPGVEATVDARSTAEALVFMNAALASSKPDTGAPILAAIRASAFLADVQQRLEARLRSNPMSALTTDDSAFAAAIERVVDDVVTRVGSPRDLRKLADALAIPAPVGSTDQGGVQVSTAVDQQGRVSLVLTNKGGRWVSGVLSYSQDGQSYTTPLTENGAAYWPNAMLSPFAVSLSGLSGGSASVPISPSPYLKVKIFGLGFQNATAFAQDLDAEYIWAPVLATVAFNLVLPVLEVALSVPALSSGVTAANASAWITWFSRSGDCTVTALGGTALALSTLNASMQNQTLTHVAQRIAVCFFKELSQPTIWQPILIPRLGQALAASVIQYVFAPLKFAILGWTVGKNAVNLVLLAQALRTFSTLHVFSFRDAALVPVSRVDVTPATAPLLVGATLQLVATVRDVAGNILNGRAVTWSSSNTGVASVSASGLVTGVAASPQVVAISATSEGKSGSARVSVSAAGTFAEVRAGSIHTCGRTNSNAVYCWGTNASGELGDGTTTGRLTPAAVSGNLAFVEVTAGNEHTCGRTNSNAVYCWGENGNGALGDGTTVDRLTPVPVSGNLAFVDVTAGSSHTCGRTVANALYCWGSNIRGALGDGTTTRRLIPVPVSGNLSFVEMTAGSSHSCGRTVGNALYCWGDNDFGQLGDGTTTRRLTPVPISGNLSFVGVTAGSFYTCGRTAVNAVYCWGRNIRGALGDGTTIDRLTPVAVSGNLTFVEVTAGGLHTCGRIVVNALYCWGDNLAGQLGDGSTTDRLTPVAVSGNLAFVEVTAGAYHTCGRTAANAVYCWGMNHVGQLGDGSTTDRATPVLVRSP